MPPSFDPDRAWVSPYWITHFGVPHSDIEDWTVLTFLNLRAHDVRVAVDFFDMYGNLDERFALDEAIGPKWVRRYYVGGDNQVGEGWLKIWASHDLYVGGWIGGHSAERGRQHHMRFFEVGVPLTPMGAFRRLFRRRGRRDLEPPGTHDIRGLTIPDWPPE